MKRYSEFLFGDMLLTYYLDEELCVSMSLIPASMRNRVTAKEFSPEPIVQIHARGDRLPNGYGNGHTMACTPASAALKFVSQEREGNTVVTVLSDGVASATTISRGGVMYVSGGTADQTDVRSGGSLRD